MKKMNPKFKIGNSVIVCDELKTKIVDVRFDEKYQDYLYYFYDENNNLKCEDENAIKIIESCEVIDHLDHYFETLINEVSDINYNVDSEVMRLCSAHYRLNMRDFGWKYGDKVDNNVWELSKQNAKLTAIENIRSNQNSIFWKKVIEKINEL
jgi:hypothetical protein